MLLVAVVAFLSAALTLFSGFGLGTILLPAFAVFFPLPVAVAATAVVHLLNNLFKLAMLGRHADRDAVLRFALPGIAAAFAGALVLGALAEQEPLGRWTLGSHEFRVTPLGLVMGLLIVVFAIVELSPRLSRITFPRRWLPLGGLLSGFFGGLSGHQGALRTAFLLRLGLPKEAFLATGIVAAVLIDLVRTATYAAEGWQQRFAGHDGMWASVAVGTLAAFAGSYLGRRLLHKVTLRGIQLLVGGLLMLLGAGIAAGVVAS